MSTITATSGISTPTTLSRAEAVPWLVWANVIASISIATGLYWDISWHETFGGDTNALVKDDRRNSVNVLGFRAPLGAFIAAWGGGAMLTSAPFDNWWHEAYGLDVKIISPPHMLLALG